MESKAALLAVATFNGSIFPNGRPTVLDVWLGIYQTLLWYEHGVPHIIDADKLRDRGVWRERAWRVEAYIAASLHRDPKDVEMLCDQLMKNPAYVGSQR